MNFIKAHWQKIIIFSFVSFLPVVTFAQLLTPAPCTTSGKICNPLGPNTTSIPALILKVLTGLIEIGIPVIALAIIYCGFLFVFARGNPEKIKTAKDALIYTLIGAAVLLGAWTIAQLVSNTVISLGSS